jgi:MFS family permease
VAVQNNSTGLWRHGDFLKLWAGETVSLLGSQVTLLAMPLTAAMALNATPLQMGAFGTVQYIPWLVVGLLAGAWIDRRRRRPVMIAADLSFLGIGTEMGRAVQPPSACMGRLFSFRRA